MSQGYNRMDHVFMLCDQLHEKMDPWRDAFRPQLTHNKKNLSQVMHGKTKKVLDTNNSYESRRIADIIEKNREREDGNK